MNNKIKVFENAEFGSVRTVTINGEPWFVAADVCRALDIDPTSTRRLDDDEKNTLRLTQGIPGNPNVTVVNEPGLYTLVLGSRKPEAKAFKRWITHEVLPSIRKNAVYATPEFLQKTISDPQWAMGVLQALADAQDKIAVQQKQISEMKPKATYYDLVLQTKNAVNITTIAKDYGLSAVTLNKKLHDYGVQYKQGGTWLLYQQYADMGYTKTRTGVYTNKAGEEYASVHTQWTQKGRMFIYEILKEHGILPKMEEESNVIRFSAM